MDQRIKIRNVQVLSNDWYVLKKTTFDYQLKDGGWTTQNQETYDRGNGATILLYNVDQKTVILTRQFRLTHWLTTVMGKLNSSFSSF